MHSSEVAARAGDVDYNGGRLFKGRPRSWHQVIEQDKRQRKYRDGEKKTPDDRRRILLRHQAVNDVLGDVGVLVDLWKQTASQSVSHESLTKLHGTKYRNQSFLTGFTSKANRTCCMSGDTWYFAALDLSYMC